MCVREACLVAFRGGADPVAAVTMPEITPQVAHADNPYQIANYKSPFSPHANIRKSNGARGINPQSKVTSRHQTPMACASPISGAAYRCAQTAIILLFHFASRTAVQARKVRKRPNFRQIPNFVSTPTHSRRVCSHKR